MQTAHVQKFGYGCHELFLTIFIAFFSFTYLMLPLSAEAGAPPCPEEIYMCDVQYFLDNGITPPEDHMDYSAWEKAIADKEEAEKVVEEPAERPKVIVGEEMGCPENPHKCTIQYLVENDLVVPQDHPGLPAWRDEQKRKADEVAERLRLQAEAASRLASDGPILEEKKCPEDRYKCDIEFLLKEGIPVPEDHPKLPAYKERVAAAEEAKRLEEEALREEALMAAAEAEEEANRQAAIDAQNRAADQRLIDIAKREAEARIERETAAADERLLEAARVAREKHIAAGGAADSDAAGGVPTEAKGDAGEGETESPPAVAKIEKVEPEFNYEAIEFPEEGQVGFLKTRIRMGIAPEAPIKVIYDAKLKNGVFSLTAQSIDRPNGKAVSSYELVLPEGREISTSIPRELGWREAERWLGSSLGASVMQKADGSLELPAPFDQIKRHDELDAQGIVIDSSTAANSDPSSIAAQMSAHRAARLWGMQAEMILNGEMTDSRLQELEAEYKAARDQRRTQGDALDSYADAVEAHLEFVRQKEIEIGAMLAKYGFNNLRQEGKKTDFEKLMSPNSTDPKEYAALQKQLRETPAERNGVKVSLDVLFANDVDVLMDLVETGNEMIADLDMMDSAYGEAKIVEEIAEERLADAEVYADAGECADCGTVEKASFPRIPGKYRVGDPIITEFKANSPVTARQEDNQIVYVVNHDELIEIYYPIFLKEPKNAGVPGEVELGETAPETGDGAVADQDIVAPKLFAPVPGAPDDGAAKAEAEDAI